MSRWIGWVSLLCLAPLVGCDDWEQTEYRCTFERRATQCGGGNWSAWEAGCVTIDSENLREEWTPERVCSQTYAGSDTHCASGCCIHVEYRNSQLHGGACPAGG
jgi:hypothetical protein